jgi:hypothetical protein
MRTGVDGFLRDVPACVLQPSEDAVATAWLRQRLAAHYCGEVRRRGLLPARATRVELLR